MMAVFAIKTAGRAVLRRSPFPNRQANIPKRQQHTPSTSKPKADEDPAKGTSIPVPNTVANLPIWQRLGPISRGFQAYGRSQRKRPLTTQFFSALVIFSLGDLSAQSISGDEYDPARTLRALVIGAGASIPSYKWSVFPFLAKHVHEN
jgi:protein Mpv17